MAIEGIGGGMQTFRVKWKQRRLLMLSWWSAKMRRRDEQTQQGICRQKKDVNLAVMMAKTTAFKCLYVELNLHEMLCYVFVWILKEKVRYCHFVDFYSESVLLSRDNPSS